jgi:hypothetical protein
VLKEIEELKQQVSLLEDKVNDLYMIIKNKEKQHQQETDLHNEIIQGIIKD